MSKFQPRKLSKKRYVQRKRMVDKKRKKRRIKLILLHSAWILVALFLLGILAVYLLFLKDAPSIDSIQTTFKESSIIYDRNGNKLYTIYGGGENRKYVRYLPGKPANQISENVINAVVAMEDQTFFTNPGFDAFGIARSVLDCVTKRTATCGSGSTLSQQLIKNVLLSSERSIDRKVKEIYLSWRLNRKFSKEKIIELYLNKISFGGNVDGVEQAAQTFFGKKALDVTPLEASILASLPKSPTRYSPYSRRNSLMGYAYVFEKENPDAHIILGDQEIRAKYHSLYDSFISYVSGLSFSASGDNLKICGVDESLSKKSLRVRDGCTEMSYVDVLDDFWNAIQFSDTFISSQEAEGGETEEVSQDLILEYQTGRKDRVLMRMLEDGYVSGDEFKEAFLGALDLEFKSRGESITYPHFVFYVQEYLEERYGSEFFEEGGWKIYTTIDPELQDKAQEIVETQVASNVVKFNINNSALVSIDNTNGEVIAMVGSADFANKDIDGEVNITTSLKQPGSSFKPVIFARAFELNSFSPETPIYDVPTQFWNWEPKNYDGEYEGPMTIKTSLAHSRNTTAVKMYYMATKDDGSQADKEEGLVNFLQGLGLSSIEHKEPAQQYGAPIALGTAEVRPLEFAGVYSTFANNGTYRPPNPILRIVDKEGNEITGEEILGEQKEEKMLDPGAAYLVTNILSDPAARPDGWGNYLSLAGGRPVAAKTGTSNKVVYTAGSRLVLPRDLWTAGYTPQMTTIVWSGNTDGTPANSRGNGLEASGVIWKKFMDYAHEQKEVAYFTRPDSVLGQGGFLYIAGQKPEVLEILEPEVVEVDGLCRGLVTDQTPQDAIKKGLLLQLHFPIEQQFASWQENINEWFASEEGREYLDEAYSFSDDLIAILESPENACERPNPTEPIVTANLNTEDATEPGQYPLIISFASDHPITDVEVRINDDLYKSHPIEEQTHITLDSEYIISNSGGAIQTVTVRLIDIYGYSYDFDYPVKLLKEDRKPPIISMNHASSLTLEPGKVHRFSGVISDESDIGSVNIYLNELLYGSLGATKNYSFLLEASGDLSSGEHILVIEAQDVLGNTSQVKVNVTIE